MHSEKLFFIRGVIGVSIGLIILAIGLFTPLPAAVLSGIGVGIISLSIVSPGLEFKRSNKIILLLEVILFLIGNTFFYVGLITPLSAIVFVPIGMLLASAGFLSFIMSTRRID